METILLFVAVILLFTLQNICFKQFNRVFMKTRPSYFIFNSVYFSLICLLFLPMGIDPRRFTAAVALLSLFFGTAFIFTMYLYMKAMENGPLGLSFLFFSAGMLAPIAFGIVFYGEPAPPHKIAALILLFAAFYISTRGGADSGRMNGKWAAYILLGSLGNGAIGIAQKLFRNVAPQNAVNEYLFLGFGQAAALSLIIGLALAGRHGEGVAHFRSAAFAFLAAAAAVTTCFGNYIMVLLSLKVSALVQFPLTNGALVITSILSSSLVFKEKVTRRHMQAIAAGFVAIIALSV
jgi:drug/metabolite transporter (DMT)-like permease